MKQVFNLKSIGIENQIELFGSLTILRKAENSPIVFLFDENHENVNDCITKNIDNAKTLITNANVVLIGVESHYGGRDWDQYDEYYTDEYEYNLASEDTLANNHPEFANSILNINQNIVYGVESFGLLGKIQADYTINNERAINVDIPNHVFQKDRSKHFIKTIFEIKSNYKLDGNLILNCGSDHNSHIEEWIKSGEIDEIVGIRASYVRVNNII